MKTILITLFLLSNTLLAQQFPVLSTSSLSNPEDPTIFTKGNYAIDTANERDQYVGLWEYSQNGVLLQLKLNKSDMSLNDIVYNGVVQHYNYTDEIVIRYKLIKNGVTLFDNLNVPLEDIDPKNSYGIKKGTDDFLHGGILDHTKNVLGSYDIKRIATTPEKIIFNLHKGGYTLLNDYSTYDQQQPLFSIPINGIEMVKIE